MWNEWPGPRLSALSKMGSQDRDLEASPNILPEKASPACPALNTRPEKKLLPEAWDNPFPPHQGSGTVHHLPHHPLHRPQLFLPLGSPRTRGSPLLTARLFLTA